MTNLFPFTPSVLPGDSRRYDILYTASRTTTIEGLSCEIGLRRGGGTEAIVQGAVDGGIKRPHIAVDPYGLIPYVVGDQTVQYDYDNNMRGQAIPRIYDFCQERGVLFLFYAMEDSEFMFRFDDGVPVYQDGIKEILTDFAFVHFDGPHNTKDVMAEVMFFAQRTPIGGSWVFDDTDLYPHHKDIDTVVKMLGFESVVDEAPKAWYRRIR